MVYIDFLKWLCILGDCVNEHWLASTSAAVEGRTERYTRHYESSRRPGL
jgi:hypothetical protein